MADTQELKMEYSGSVANGCHNNQHLFSNDETKIMLVNGNPTLSMLCVRCNARISVESSGMESLSGAIMEQGQQPKEMPSPYEEQAPIATTPDASGDDILTKLFGRR